MSLRLVYGRAGTGKSTYILNEIKKRQEEKTCSNYIITPEQFSYTMERKLLEILDKKSVINTEVITFNRMSQRICNEVGGNKEVTISKSAKAMLIYDILEKQKDKLKVLCNSKNDIELSMQTIKEFKKHNVKNEDIRKVLENVKNPLLKTKLEDIESIYSSYKRVLSEKYIDEEDLLTKLSKKIERSNIFDNSNIYIDEFAGFTEQEYLIIKELLKKAKRITVLFCIDNLEKKDMEEDIFFWNKKAANRIIEIAKEQNIEIEEPIFLENQFRLESEELKHLEKNIYSIPYDTYEKETKDINIYLSLNPYSELEDIACTIVKLVRDDGYRYNDISIITDNVEDISSAIKAIFKKYEIPVFIDKKDELIKTPLIKYIFSLLDILTKNWSQEAIFTYAKTGFIDVSREEIYKLENYAVKYGIKGKKWQQDECFIEADNSIIEIKNKIINPILKLKEELSKEKTAENICRELYSFIQENGIYDKILEKAEELEKAGEILISKQYEESLNILIDIFDEIVEYFKKEKMSFDRFKEILKVGITYKELGNIPETIDEVIIGDIARSKTHNVKCVFVLGANDGVFQASKGGEGFLNDDDREELKLLGTEIAKGTTELLYEDQFNMYKALTNAKNKIYIYYTSTDKEGKSLRPSILISKIKKIFPKLVEESNILNNKIEISTKQATFEKLLQLLRAKQDGENVDEIYKDLYNWYSKSPTWNEKLKIAQEGLNYTNKPEKLSKENIERLYGNILKTSISRLEQYKKCPFSFYLKYGLKLKDVERYEIKSIDTGTFMHDIIAEFFTRVKNVKDLEYDEIPEIVNDIIDEKLKLKANYMFTSSPKFITLTRRLKSVITKSIKYIVYQLKNSNFEVLANEVEFTKTIDDIEISGKIDRVDISQTGDYIRVIDYKSSSKNINLNEVLAGIQIQLLTYIDIISEKQKKIKAGAFYFNLIETIINKHKNLSKEEIEKEIRKEFRMKGLILADITVTRMMDKTLENGQSDIIPVYIDKHGNLSKSKSSAVSKEEFERLQEKVRQVIKDIAKEIRSGNIDIKPIYNKKTKNDNCKYCEYQMICQFNSKENTYSYVDNKTKEEILEELKEEA